jgi:hypothetical protein
MTRLFFLKVFGGAKEVLKKIGTVAPKIL